MKLLRYFSAIGLLALGTVAANAESINPPTETQLSPAMTSQERANLEFVLDWWREVIQGGRMDRTVYYQAEDYIQHNPNVPTGRAAFVNFFENVIGVEPADPTPAWLDPAPVVAGAKGDFVFLIFEEESVNPRDPSTTYHHNSFELLRIENGRVAEHWDSARRFPTPEGAPKPPRFEQPAMRYARGGTGRMSADERRNLELATIEMKDMLQYGHLELADEVMDPGYIQHNPNVPQGRQGFKDFMAARPGREPMEIKDEWPNPPSFTLVSGPYVWMQWDRTAEDPNYPGEEYVWNHFDVLRVENGLIKEHWDEAVIAPPQN